MVFKRSHQTSVNCKPQYECLLGLVKAAPVQLETAFKPTQLTSENPCIDTLLLIIEAYFDLVKPNGLELTFSKPLLNQNNNLHRHLNLFR